MPFAKFFIAKIFRQKPKQPLVNQPPKNDFWLSQNNQSAEIPLTNNWLGQEDEGQLSVDVYETSNSIVIKSTIAGLKPEDIDISLDNDMLTIRGKRASEDQVASENYFYQECYWGNFSRSIILPSEVQEDKIKANLKNGILTIELPKAKHVNVDIKIK